MNVLITGGTGFVGRHLVTRLSANGWRVAFTGRNHQAASSIVESSGRRAVFVSLDHGTRGAKEILVRAAKGIDACIHCAALSAPWGKEEDFLRANVRSTQEVLAACEAHSIKRLIHISTPAIYVEPRNRIAIREDDPLPSPMTLYAQTKLVAERLFELSCPAETVVLRPRAVHGPFDTVLLPRLLRVARTRAVPLVGEGRALLDLTYIDNLVDAVQAALTRPLPNRVNTYNISNGDPISFASLLERLTLDFGVTVTTRPLPFAVLTAAATIMEGYASIWTKREPPITRYGAVAVSFSQTLCIEKAARELGYTPRVATLDGLRRHARWYREQQV